jgi:hypothetical protein
MQQIRRNYVVETNMHRPSYVFYVAFGKGEAKRKDLSFLLLHYPTSFLLRILRIIVYNIVIASGF